MAPTSGTQLPIRDNSLILLYVNTRPTNAQGSRIPLTQANIKDYVIIADTSNDVANDTGDNVVNYESQVKTGGKVTWVGAVSNHGTGNRDFVIITGVSVNQGSSGITPPSRLPNPGVGTYVQANITGAQNTETEYTINFNVWYVEADDSYNYLSFSIDPILKIH